MSSTPVHAPEPSDDGSGSRWADLMRADDDRPIQAELGREQYGRIRAITGERVYVKPRKVRVFMHEEGGLVASRLQRAHS